MKYFIGTLLIFATTLSFSQSVKAKDIIFYCESSDYCQESLKKSYAKTLALAKGSVGNGSQTMRQDRVIYYNLETGHTNMFNVVKSISSEPGVPSFIGVSNALSTPSEYLDYFSDIKSVIDSYTGTQKSNIHSDYVTLTGGNVNLVGVPASVLNQYSNTPVNSILLNSGQLGVQTSEQLYSMIEQALGGASYLDSLSSVVSTIMESFGIESEVSGGINAIVETQGRLSASTQAVTSRSGINSQRFRILSVAGVSQLEVTIEYNFRTKSFRVVKIIDSEGNRIPVDENGALTMQGFDDNQVYISNSNADIWSIIASRLGCQSLLQALANNKRGYVTIEEL